MSKRSVLIIKDESNTFYIYRHWDGDPKTVIRDLETVVNSNKVWALPRFEADEFAAGLLATLKTSEGNYRLVNYTPELPDVGQEFVYRITAAQGRLRVACNNEIVFISRTV